MGFNTSHLIKKIKYYLKPFLLMLPNILIIMAGFFIPLFLLFLISFYKGIPGSGLIEEVFTLENYVKFVTDFYYVEVFMTTFMMAVYSTLLSLIIGYPLAYIFVRASSKISRVILLILITPLLTNRVARTLGIMIIFGRHGPVNNFFRFLGLPPVEMVPGMLGIVLGLTQVFTPFMVLSISSVLKNVDFSLMEAARNLGCSRFQAFRKVILPLSIPGIAAGSLFVFLLSFSSFVTPRLLGGGMVTVMTTLIYTQVMRVLNWPFAAAAAVVLLLVVGVIVTVYTRAMTSSIELQAAHRRSFYERTKKNLQNKIYILNCKLSKQFEKVKIDLKIIGAIKALFSKIQRPLAIGIIIFILVFILSPLPVVILSSFHPGRLIRFPPEGFSFRHYETLMRSVEYFRSFIVSMQLAFLSVIISVLAGTLASLGITRFDFPGKNIMKSIFISPLMLPAVIIGLALLRLLVELGWQASFQGVLMGHLLLTTAYCTRTMTSTLIGFDRSLEEAARDLGAGVLQTFFKITLPIIKPGIFASAIFAFVVSLGETTISVFTTGPGTITIAVRIFSQLEYGLDPAATAVSSLLIGFAVIILVLLEKVIGINTIYLDR